MTRLPVTMRDVLETGAFCHVAARTARGPHLTPLVFVWSDDRVWVTTSRGSVKARAWRADPRVAGLVRHGERAVAFAGTVAAYDVFEPGTWQRALARSPAVARATVRFTQRNARFFAGYAIDARRVPLSWTPPGRIFVEIEIERAVALGGDRVRASFGAGVGGEVASKRSFRRARPRPDALSMLPEDLSVDLRHERDGVLAIDADAAIAVVPARWTDEDGTLSAAVPREVLGAMGLSSATGRAALVVERPSWWRATRMTGAMLQGDADVYDPAQLGSGSRSVRDRIERVGRDRDAFALIRMRPDRVVWWRGWQSGSRVVA